MIFKFKLQSSSIQSVENGVSLSTPFIFTATELTKPFLVRIEIRKGKKIVQFMGKKQEK